MFTYVYKKGLLGGKLVNSQGQELKMKGLKVKQTANGFVVSNKQGMQTPEIQQLTSEGPTVFEGVAKDGLKVLVDSSNASISEQYIERGGKIIITPDKKIKEIDRKLQSKDTGYTAVLKEEVDRDKSAKSMYIYSKYRLFVAQDKNGKFGLIEAETLENACPCVFDSPEIEHNATFRATEKNNNLYSFSSGGLEVIVKDDGEMVQQKPFVAKYKEVGTTPDGIKYACFDEKTNTSKIYNFSQATYELTEDITLTGEASGIVCRDQEDKPIYRTTNNGKVGATNTANQEVVPHDYDWVSQMIIDNTNYGIVEVSRNYKKPNNPYSQKYVGVYSIAHGAEIVPTEFEKIDDYYSTLAKNGKLRFFATKDNRVGVINSQGEVELDFKYTTSNVSTQRYVYENGKVVDRVNALEIRDEKGNKEYLNLKEDRIMATGEEKKGVYEYEAELRQNSSEYYEKKSKEQAKKSQKESEPKYSEGEKFMASVAASVVMESPIAGMIVNELMEEENQKGNE